MGVAYLAIERALWVLGPVLIVLMLLSIPAQNAPRQQAEADAAREIAAENLEYCTKWGMPSGTAYERCVQDLVGIRARTELRLRNAIASEF